MDKFLDCSFPRLGEKFLADFLFLLYRELNSEAAWPAAERRKNRQQKFLGRSREVPGLEPTASFAGRLQNEMFRLGWQNEKSRNGKAETKWPGINHGHRSIGFFGRSRRRFFLLFGFYQRSRNKVFAALSKDPGSSQNAGLR